MFASTAPNIASQNHTPPANNTNGTCTAAIGAIAISDASGTPRSATPTRSTTRRCGIPECAKTAKPGGYCIAHGGGKKCSVPHCTTSVVSRGYCVAHGGGKRCQHPGCTKSAQTGGCCWLHGGGKKCGVNGCGKRAQSGGACIAHGGGKRCRMSDCNKVVQFDGLCVSHGGFRKCVVSDCNSKALANSYCHAHGGHSQCRIGGCSHKAVKCGLCSDHKSKAAIARTTTATPVTSGAPSPDNSTLHHSIEPQHNKHQQQTSTGNVSATLSTPFASTRSSPSVWPLELSCAPDALLPSFAFAKDRPSLRAAESLLHTTNRSPMDHGFHIEQTPSLQSSRHRNSSTSITASPILPVLRMHSPLPSLGKRNCSPATMQMRSNSSSNASPLLRQQQQQQQPPIKRFASLANIAKLSRPLTPFLTPLVDARADATGATTANW